MKSTLCRRAVLGLLLSLPSLAQAQVSAFGAEAPPPKAGEKKTAAEEKAKETAVKTPEAVFEKMSLKERIAQLMLVTLQGEINPSGEDMSFLKEYLPGGVLIRKTTNAETAASYVEAVRQCEGAAKIPLLIGADMYELARRERNASKLYAQLPSLLSVAATRDVACAAQLGEALAEQCESVGLNLYLGPSLELAPTLEEAPGTLDTLGGDPQFVGEAGVAILKALAAKKIFTLPMGFPGGGNNRVGDTPAVMLTPEPLFEKQDLLPYVQAIDSGAAFIHVANTLVPTLDVKTRPASLSKAVITGLLRTKLHFGGIVVAGPLDGEDLGKRIDPAEAALQALEAGADMLYWSGTEGTVMRVEDRLLQLVKAGQLNEALINEAAKRVMKMKEGMKAMPQPAGGNRKWSSSLEKHALKQDAYHVERRAITMVKNNGQTLPLDKHSGMVGVVGTIEVENFRDALQKHISHIPQFRIATAKQIGDIEDFEIERVTKNYGAVRTMICVFAEAPRITGQIRLIAALKKAGMNVVVIRLGYPAQLDEFDEADAMVLAYCGNETYDETLHAVADVLVGEGPIRIDLPEKELVFKAGEARRFNTAEVVRTPTGYLPVNVSETFPVGLGLHYDPAKAIRKAQWEFGDGKKAKGPSVEHSFARPGLYDAKLNVTGRKKESASRAFRITVEE